MAGRAFLALGCGLALLLAVLLGMHVGAHTKGGGYFDAEHVDDRFVPVSSIAGAQAASAQEGDSEAEARKELYGNWDAFVEPEGDSSGDAVVAANAENSEMKRDDAFVPPAGGLSVPEHNPPEEQYQGWELALRNTLKSVLG